MVSNEGACAHLSLLAAYAYEIAGQTKEAIELCNSENVITFINEMYDLAVRNGNSVQAEKFGLVMPHLLVQGQ